MKEAKKQEVKQNAKLEDRQLDQVQGGKTAGFTVYVQKAVLN